MILNTISKRKYKSTLLHIILWGGLLLLNYFIVGMPGLEFDFTFPLLTWLVYMMLFYLNFSLLVPKFFFKKKYLLYGLLLIATFSFSLYLKTKIDDYFFSNIDFRLTPNQIEHSNNPIIKDLPPFNNGPFMPRIPREMPQKKLLALKVSPFFVAGLSQLMLIFLASISLRFLIKWQDDEKRKAEIEKEKISTELSFLKQQINPHFLFNAINNIYSLSISLKPETSDAILKLSAILRYMLYETDKANVSLNDEIQAIKNYIELQKLRLTDKVKLKFELNGNTSGYQIVPLIMMPLIENAFKHGVDNANDSFIDIQINIEKSYLILKIKNRIVTKNPKIEGSGIGIKNIIRRLELLYPGSYELESTVENDVFKIFLKIKLEQ